MKSFWYGFCNVMSQRIELPHLAECEICILGQIAAEIIIGGVFMFTLFAVCQLIVDIMLGKFAM